MVKLQLNSITAKGNIVIINSLLLLAFMHQS